MRLAIAGAAALTLGLAVPTVSQPAPPPALAGTASDLGGTWRQGTTSVKFSHKGGGDHAVTGTLTGTARVGAAASGGQVYVDFTHGGTTERLLASRDRTKLVGAGRTLERATPAGHARLRCMTYNIKGVEQRSPSDMNKLAQFVKREAPDIVALQEVSSIFRADQADIIAALAGYESAFGESRRNFILGQGVAVMVRKGSPLKPDIVASRNVKLPKAPNAPSSDLARNALVCDVKLGANGKTIRVISTHLSHRVDHEPSRILQCEELLRQVSGPTVLMGDLNARPDQRPVAIVRQKFLDAFGAANPGIPGFSYSSTAPRIRIDYVMINKGRALASWVDAAGAMSDHSAVTGVVELSLSP